MARIVNPFNRTNDRRRRRNKVYESSATMRLGVDLANLTRQDRPRTGHSVHPSQPDLRRKRAKVAAAATHREAPTVMVRSISTSMPLRPTRSQKKARRRYDIALGMPGTEVRLPGLPQIAIGWRWLSAVLAIILGFVLYQVWNASAFQVEQIEIGGLQRLTSTEVNAVLGMAGKPIFSLDSNQIQNELMQAFPEFSSASVQIGLPNSVTITVTERIPVLAWMLNGSATLVDQTGAAFPARSSLPSDFGPVVEASAPPPALYVEEPQADLQDITASTPQVAERTAPTGAQPFMTPEFVTAVLTLAEQAPLDVPLLYDGSRGFGWRDPGGWDVYFGDAQEMPMKLLVYQEIIARLDDKEETLPSLVSVEYVHAPYYRLR